MTPLAMRFANDLALQPSKRKVDDRAGLLGLIDSDLHCFEVSAVAKHVHGAMDQENMWPEVESMAPGMFLPSPVTWLEFGIQQHGRMAWVVQGGNGDRFRLSMVGEGPEAPYSLPVCDFRPRNALELGDRIEQTSLVDSAFAPDDEREPEPIFVAVSAVPASVNYRGRAAMRRNVATVEGRALGVEIARLADREAQTSGRDGRCATCAFRAGEHLANGSPETLMTAIKCVAEREPFWCHEHDRPCAGWSLMRFPADGAITMPWDAVDGADEQSERTGA